MNNPGDAMDSPKKSRVTLLLLLGLFVLPILVVLTMYQFSMRPGGASHGELVRPPRPLHFSPLMTWQNKLFPEDGLHEKWSLLYVTPAICSESCVAQVRMMRQIHAALGKEMGRVQRIVLAAESSQPDQLDAMQRDYPDLIILAKPARAVAQIADQLRMPAQADGSLYLIDPLGNVMMHYPPAADPNGIRKDMSRLLSYSWAG
ncbi:MAG: hypothetical protein D4R48_01935 [Nitrosomonadales bacterium]|nr:MAG: hypothetical protein D4R48_01935 [Nitrosomonadales bacterium]